MKKKKYSRCRKITNLFCRDSSLMVLRERSTSKDGCLLFESKDYSIKKDRCINKLLKPLEDAQVQIQGQAVLEAIQKRNYADFSNSIRNFSPVELNNMRFNEQGILHLLCFRKDEHFLKEAIKLEMNPNVGNDEGTSPLQIAVKENWEEGVKLLVECGALVDISSSQAQQGSLESPILIAIKHGDTNIFRDLMKLTPNLLVTDHKGNSVLHLAASSLSIDMLNILLKCADVASQINCTNHIYESPMHKLPVKVNFLIDEKNVVECAEILITHGVDINLTDINGQSALYLAAQNNHLRLVIFLLACGANANILTSNGRSVLHAACLSGNYAILEAVINSCKLHNFVSLADNNGLRPFHCAVNSISRRCCEILLRNGENLANMDFNGQTLCTYLIQNMSGATIFIEKILNSYITLSTEDKNDPNLNIKFDFSVISKCPTISFEYTLIEELNSKSTDVLLNHPLVESFIYLKWKSTRYTFYTNMIFHTLFLIFHSWFISAVFTGENANMDMVHSSTYVIEIILLSLLLLAFMLHLFANFRKYSKQFETYFKGAAFLSAGVVLIMTTSEVPSMNGRIVAATSIFFNWVEFMLLLGRSPTLGSQIFMFTKISKTLLTFIFSFGSLILAFSFAFAVLLYQSKHFKTIQLAITKTLIMMLGEIDYNSFRADYNKTMTMTQYKGEADYFVITTDIFLICFIFLIPILLINFIIAIAVNDMAGLQTYGSIRRLVKQASYIHSYGRVLNLLTSVPSMGWMKCIKRRSIISNELTIYPNEKNQHIQPRLPYHIISGAIALCTNENRSDHQSYNYDAYHSSARMERMAEAILKSNNAISRKLDEVVDILTIMT